MVWETICSLSWGYYDDEISQNVCDDIYEAPEAGLSGGMVVGGISRVWGHGDNVMSYDCGQGSYEIWSHDTEISKMTIRVLWKKNLWRKCRYISSMQLLIGLQYYNGYLTSFYWSLWHMDLKTFINFKLLDIQIIGVMAFNNSSNWFIRGLRSKYLWTMLITRVQNKLMMIVIMKSSKPVSTSLKWTSYQKLVLNLSFYLLVLNTIFRV